MLSFTHVCIDPSPTQPWTCHPSHCHPWIDLLQRALQDVPCSLCWIAHGAHSIVFISSMSLWSLAIYHLRSFVNIRLQFVVFSSHIPSDAPVVSIDLESPHIVAGSVWAGWSIGHFHLVILELSVAACSKEIKGQQSMHVFIERDIYCYRRVLILDKL